MTLVFPVKPDAKDLNIILGRTLNGVQPAQNPSERAQQYDRDAVANQDEQADQCPWTDRTNPFVVTGHRDQNTDHTAK